MANAQIEHYFLPTSRGGRYLCMGGYMYRINKRKAGDWISWQCQKADCSSTVSTTNDLISKLPSPHNHDATEMKIQVKKSLQRMKMKAMKTLKPMPSLYNEELLSLREGPWTEANKSVVQAMPSYDTVKNRLYKARRTTFPSMPASRRDIVIPDEYTRTDGGEQFLFVNDGEDEKILGFTTRGNLQHLCAADVFYGDGTFFVSPKLFLQLYTIHAKVAGQMFPLVFFLLPNKTTQTYTRAFQLLKDAATNLGLQLSPQIVQMDFEAAAKSAVLSVFPAATWKGCFFLFTQCVWRKTQNAGLQRLYNDDPEVTILVRRCAVLPLIPQADVEDVWLQTLADMPPGNMCLELADYVTTQRMEGDLSSWNHHNTDGPRTNNHLEGWHGRMKKVIGKAHPNVFEMVQFLRDEQKLNELRLVQYQAGQRLPPKKAKYTSIGARLDNLKQRLAAGAISAMYFADAASHLLKLK